MSVQSLHDEEKVARPENASAPAIPLRTWIAVLGTVLGAFMAVLDIQITNSSLKDIQGALGATLDEGTWISTSYLVAEIVVIPLSGWLVRIFSIRRLLLANALFFVIFSMLCGMAWDLNSMIAFRALQGATGGFLIPLAMTVILTMLPPAKQPVGLALFGLTATFAPTIGPTLGGWLTDNMGWKYIFYINLVPGILLLIATWFALPRQPMQLRLLREGDWWGIITMAIGLGALQVVLEEGNRKDWFDSDFITRWAVVATVCLAAFLVIELRSKHPFINLSLIKRRNFALAGIVNVVLGVGLYGSVFLLPTYLAQVQGLSAMQIGQVMIWFGLPQLFIIPFIPKLMAIIDRRILISLGVLLFALSCLVNLFMTHDTGVDQLIASQLIRAFGQPLIFVPLSSVATSGIAPAEAGSASALFNMMRNLGGSVGIASIATFLTRREHFHSNRLGEAVSLWSPDTHERIGQWTEFFISRGADAVTAHNQALAQIANLVRREAFVMAYGDCFALLAVILLVSLISVLFFQRTQANAHTTIGSVPKVTLEEARDKATLLNAELAKGADFVERR